MKEKRKICVVGSGYVGMSLAVLLAQHNEVIVYDIDHSRVEKINNNRSCIDDSHIEFFLNNKNLIISATSNIKIAFKDADFIVVATPTDYDPANNEFDTTSVDSVVNDALDLNSQAIVVIKSTIPIGHTKFLQQKHNTERVIFSPEFLREGQALHDNLYPSRIIIGSDLDSGKVFANLLTQSAEKKDIDKLFISSTEAEAVKLFSNSYLAMRISFINELDSYALSNNLETKNIIDGLCLDERIGSGYNNPSFGYGGYCLPKDTKQLLANFNEIPQTLIKAIVSSNKTRKDFIVEEILKLKPKVVGIYRLIMKEGSDNFRSSSILDIIKGLKTKDVKIVIYEPKLDVENFHNEKVLIDLNSFKEISDVIVANRYDKCLEDVSNKCFTRDVYGNN